MKVFNLRKNTVYVDESFFPISDFFTKNYTFYDIAEETTEIDLEKALRINPYKPEER